MGQQRSHFNIKFHQVTISLVSLFTLTLVFRSSCRQLSVYHIDNLSQACSVTEINIAPGILIPYFDEDTNIVFLGAKVNNEQKFVNIKEGFYRAYVCT